MAPHGADRQTVPRAINASSGHLGPREMRKNENDGLCPIEANVIQQVGWKQRGRKARLFIPRRSSHGSDVATSRDQREAPLVTLFDQSTSWFRTAYAAISALLRIPIFSRIRARYVLTVLTLKPSSFAMTAGDTPRAMRVKTCNSRSDKRL